jgi:hypothetical protein
MPSVVRFILPISFGALGARVETAEGRRLRPTAPL